MTAQQGALYSSLGKPAGRARGNSLRDARRLPPSPGKTLPAGTGSGERGGKPGKAAHHGAATTIPGRAPFPIQPAETGNPEAAAGGMAGGGPIPPAVGGMNPPDPWPGVSRGRAAHREPGRRWSS